LFLLPTNSPSINIKCKLVIRVFSPKPDVLLNSNYKLNPQQRISGAVMNRTAYSRLVLLLLLAATLGLPVHQTNANPIAVPTIDLMSPKGGTYNTNQIELVFVAPSPNVLFSNITFTSFSYSLDGEPLIPISGNTTISGLSAGTHTLLVYGHTDGATERSQTVHFDVYISSLLIVAMPVILALSAGVAIVYAKKRRSKRVR
jgi:hypothetical protein